MTGVAGLVVRVAARSLPALRRIRYREEWLADLDGAAEAGVSRSSIALAAVSTAVTIDRLDPDTMGMTLSRAFTLRLRAATGFGLAAAVLAVGAEAYAGFPTIPVLGPVLTVLVVALGLAATVAGVAAVRAAVAARRPAAALLVVLAAAGLVAVVVSRLGPMLVILGALPAAAVLLTVAIMLTDGRVASRSARLAATLVAAVTAPAVAALGLAHVFVWNPLAKLPGLGLSEIYARLAAAGELPIAGPVGWVVLVGVLVGVGVGAYAVFALAPVRRWQRHRTRRRLAALGLLLIGGVVAAVFLPGFSMGMGIADTFMTSGGDAAASGGILAVVGMLAVAGTILVSFVRIEPGPPQGVRAPA